MTEPLGIALELRRRREAFAARLSPQARRLAYPSMFRPAFVAEPPEEKRKRPTPIDDEWSTPARPTSAIKARELQPKSDLIVATVARIWGIPPSLVYAPTKKHMAVRPRRAVMALLRTLCDASLPTIGLLIDRDHTTIKTGLDRHADDYEARDDYRRQFDAAEAELREVFTRNAATSDTAAAGGERDGCPRQPSPTSPAKDTGAA